MKKPLIAFFVLQAAFLVSSAAVRRMEAETVLEGSTITVKSQGAEDAKASDERVASAAVRGKDVTVTGLGLGSTEIMLTDARGAFASFPVKVVPTYWEILSKIFADDPEISREVLGGKVVLSGATASADTLKRVNEAKELDPDRIVSQVTYSSEALQSVVVEFLRRSGATNIAVNVVGREICLSGKVYDPATVKSLGDRVLHFLQEFPGVTVNVEGIQTYRQKILIDIEFVEWNDDRARNLGIKLGDSLTITAGEGLSAGAKYEMKSGDRGDWTETYNFGGDSLLKTDGLKATINLAKNNGVARKTYGTQLATQSGEPVEFKNGGTRYVKTLSGGLTSGDLKQFDYGYNLTAKPVIIDRETVSLDFKLDYSKLLNSSQTKDGGDYELVRYGTNSKYIVRPGETIVLSGFKSDESNETKHGWPLLSHIWGLQWLFGNKSHEDHGREMLLVVTVNWMVEDSDGAKAKLNEISTREVSVEMP